MTLTRTACHRFGGNRGRTAVWIGAFSRENNNGKGLRREAQRWVREHPATAIVCGWGASSTALALAFHSDRYLDAVGDVGGQMGVKPEAMPGDAWVLILLLSSAGRLVLSLIPGFLVARWLDKRLEKRAVHLALVSETQVILQHACLQLLDHYLRNEVNKSGQKGEDAEEFYNKAVWLMQQIEVQSSALEELMADHSEHGLWGIALWDAANFIQRTLSGWVQGLEILASKASEKCKIKERRGLRHMGSSGRFDTMRKERARLEELLIKKDVDKYSDDAHHPLWVKYLQAERNALENHPSWKKDNQETIPDDSSDKEDYAEGNS